MEASFALNPVKFDLPPEAVRAGSPAILSIGQFTPGMHRGLRRKGAGFFQGYAYRAGKSRIIEFFWRGCGAAIFTIYEILPDRSKKYYPSVRGLNRTKAYVRRLLEDPEGWAELERWYLNLNCQGITWKKTA